MRNGSSYTEIRTLPRRPAASRPPGRRTEPPPFSARTRDRAAPGNSVPPPSRGQALVRLDLARGEYLAHRPLSQLRQARMAGTWPVVAGMCGQQPGGPQFMRVAELRRLCASQRHKPSPRFRRDRRLASRPRAIVERRQHAQFRGSLQTTRHRLLAHPDPTRHGVGRRIVEIGENNAGSLHSVRWFGARPRNLRQRPALVRVNRYCNDPSSSNHGFPLPSPLLYTTYRQKQHSSIQHIDNSESLY